jgi:pyruvate ferredoxin oxidoreductase alpha subunit
MEDEEVKAFVGEYKPEFYLNNSQNPVSVGPLDLPVHYFEHKREQAEAMKNAKQAIIDISKEFGELTGRNYGLFEEYKLEDAEIAVVVLNSTAGTAKTVVDELREKGIKAGLLKVRVFRPFPADEIAKALSHLKVVAIMDKAESFNACGGPLFTDVTSAMYGRVESVKAINYIYGLGGRDVPATDIMKVYDRMLNILETGETGEIYNYLGVRE